MANISQTAANVAPGSLDLKIEKVTYGESVTQGMPLYQSTADSKWYQCDANDGIAKAACNGIAMSAGATDGPGFVGLPSTTQGMALINLGATLAVGTMYGISATKGAIAPIADIGTGEFPTSIGFAVTAALLDFQVTVCTVAKA